MPMMNLCNHIHTAHAKHAVHAQVIAACIMAFKCLDSQQQLDADPASCCVLCCHVTRHACGFNVHGTGQRQKLTCCCNAQVTVLYCVQAVIPVEKLRDFIAYARTRCQPELSDEAAQDLVNAYQTMRHQGVGRNTITATPRQLESMSRLSEALARMRLSAVVERHDVAEAVRLMKVSSLAPCTAVLHCQGIVYT